jgi:hypothetical protein
LDAGLTILLRKRIIVVTTGCSLVESFKEGYGSKKGRFADDDGTVYLVFTNISVETAASNFIFFITWRE